MCDGIHPFELAVKTHKTCTKCLVEKPLDMFYKSKQSSDGHRFECKPCNNDRIDEYKSRNPEKVKEDKRRRYRTKPYGKAGNKARYERYKESYLMQSMKSRRTLDGHLKMMVRNAKKRSVVKNCEFGLSFEWAKDRYEKQEGRCLLTGIEFETNARSVKREKCRRYPYAPSIDRIDNSKGYTKENTRLVCVAVNVAMNDFGDEIFAKVCKGFMETLNAARIVEQAIAVRVEE